jgi:hypothetical protein
VALELPRARRDKASLKKQRIDAFDSYGTARAVIREEELQTSDRLALVQ